ncbi:MAG: hypothetical protein KJO51_00685 [Gramella sp.]|nr:hypothetical protein [Christiangramia sp.]
MQYYYTSRKPDAQGAISVHAEKCRDLPHVLSRIYLGIYPNGSLAKQSAIENLQLTKVRICKCCLD